MMATHFLLPLKSQRLRLTLLDRSALAFRLVNLWMPQELPGAATDASCAEQSQQARQAAKAPRTAVKAVRGVVLILFDAVRGDRFEKNQNQQPLMPALHAISDHGWSYLHAYATYPATSIAVKSIMNSQWNFVPTEQNKPIKQMPRLATWLKDAGIKSIAISSHPTVSKLSAGFNIVDKKIADLPDLRFALTSEQAFTQVRKQISTIHDDERFFFLVHLYDPHGEFVPNPMFRFGYGNEDRYDAEVAWAEHWMGRIHKLFQDRFGKDRLAFIFSADHGEEFFEHRYAHHGHQLYNESIRVPLVLEAPGLTQKNIDSPVSSTDIAPTILDLLGLPLPQHIAGRSLLRDNAADDGQRLFFAHIDDRRAVIRGHHKLIWNTRSGVTELYDLIKDPKELNNLADDDPALVERLFCAQKATAKRSL